RPTVPPFPYTTLFRSKRLKRESESGHSARVTEPVKGTRWKIGAGIAVVIFVIAFGAGVLLRYRPSQAPPIAPTPPATPGQASVRSEEHTSELQSPYDL